MKYAKPVNILVLVLLAAGMYFGYTKFIKKSEVVATNTDSIQMLDTLAVKAPYTTETQANKAWTKPVERVYNTELKTTVNTEIPVVAKKTKKKPKSEEDWGRTKKEENSQEVNNVIPNF